VPSQGELLFEAYCAHCHMSGGQGLKKLIPPIAASDYLNQNWNQLACIIKYGQQAEILVNGVVYSEPMPANEKMTEVEISNIITYIQSKWYPEKSVQNILQLRETLNNCQN